MDTPNPTICEVCNRIVSRLLEVEHSGAKTEIRGPVQNFIRPPSTAQSKQERLRKCYVCSQMKRNVEDCDIRLRGNLEGELRFDVYYYRGTEQIGENFVTSTYFARRVEQDIYDIAKDCTRSTGTGSKKSQALISHWFNTCLHQHSKCEASGGQRWYPRRVLDVSGDYVCLLETADHALNGPYATMSHCWGVKRFLTMTSENKAEFEAGIDLAILPRNFQDAITLAKSLSIRYIWIDCYCIMQSSDSDDHKKEKLLDIAQMKQVYANSILNIAASHGSSPEAGCFVERERSGQLLPCLIKPEIPGSENEDAFHLYNLLESQDYVRKLNGHRIFTRAWILQERLLCPRVIHFGSQQLYWECKELLPASETFPCGQKSQPATSVFSTEDEDLVKSARYTWCRAVQDYSAMQLTKPFEDKLVAIGGIAEHIANVTNDQYVAGLFKDNFILQLCWEARGVDPKRTTEWRAPSWSWASMDSEVFLESHLLASSVYTALAFIHTPNFELSDPMNPYVARSKVAVEACLMLIRLPHLAMAQ
jgi:hypothetical protein